MTVPKHIPGHERPCRPAMPVFAGPPAREPLIDEAIELSQRPPADPTEVVPSAPDIRIELDDHLVETQPRLSRLPSQFITSASQRLWRDVEIQPLKPPLMRVAQKGERFASHVQHTRLVRMQRQSKPRHQLLKPGERSIWTMRREQDEIIRIADQSSDSSPRCTRRRKLRSSRCK